MNDIEIQNTAKRLTLCNKQHSLFESVCGEFDDSEDIDVVINFGVIPMTRIMSMPQSFGHNCHLYNNLTLCNKQFI